MGDCSKQLCARPQAMRTPKSLNSGFEFIALLSFAAKLRCGAFLDYHLFSTNSALISFELLVTGRPAELQGLSKVKGPLTDPTKQY